MIAICLIGVLSSFAVADRMPMDDFRAIASPSEMTTRFTDFVTDFESYTVGPIGGQDGWEDGVGGALEIVTSPAIDTQSFESNGTKGWGAFRLVGNNPGGGTVSWDWYFTNPDGFGANQQFLIQSPTDGLVVTRVERYWSTETLRVLVDDGAGGAEWLDSGVDIAQDTWVHFDLEVAPGGAIELLMNGSPLLSGQGFSDNLEEVVVLNDEYEFNDMYLDNLSVTPEPASLLLLGLAGLVLRRR
jgi:hypothetical protein